MHGDTPAMVVTLRSKENKDMYGEALHIMKICTCVIPVDGRFSKELKTQKSYRLGPVARRELKIRISIPCSGTMLRIVYVGQSLSMLTKDIRS